MNKKLTQKYLKECLTYDPNTGIFTWNVRPLSHFKNSRICNNWNSRFCAKEAGIIGSHIMYRRIRVDAKLYLAHRLAFLYMEGYFPENQVDHMDRNRQNNKWENLREVSRQCNSQNCNLAKNNTSGVCGVYFDMGLNKWVAHIKISGKTIHLGCFENFDDAVMRRYYEELNNAFWTCSIESTAYKYLKDKNLLDVFPSKDFTKNNLISTNASGVTGVGWDKSRNKWKASMMNERKNINLGRYDKFEDAVMARYQKEVSNPNWKFSQDSSAYKYLKERNLI
jgi:hypothetical protein